MEQDHKHYQDAFSFEKGGYGPGTNWYRAGLRNINEEDEKSMYRTTSLCALCLPFFPIQSLRLKLVLYHLQFSHPTNMQYRYSYAGPHLNTPNLANRLYRLLHHCHGEFCGADAATRP
jgi:hypothetical protein